MAIEHKYLMELCLEHHNPEAHYIEGINQYFFHTNPSKAIDYLRQSVQGKHDKEWKLESGEKDFRHPKMGTNVNYIQRPLEKDQKNTQWLQNYSGEHVSNQHGQTQTPKKLRSPQKKKHLCKKCTTF